MSQSSSSSSSTVSAGVDSSDGASSRLTIQGLTGEGSYFLGSGDDSDFLPYEGGLDLLYGLGVD